MRKIVEVTQLVSVEVPDSLFTEAFMQEFRQQFYDFDSADDHLCHLAQLCARGLVNDQSFIEGYGKADELGIKLSALETDTFVQA